MPIKLNNHKYGLSLNKRLETVASEITEKEDLSTQLVKYYPLFISKIGLDEFREVLEFKALECLGNPSFYDYLEIIKEHNLTDEQKNTLCCNDDKIGYYFKRKETKEEKEKRIKEYKNNNFTKYIHYMLYSACGYGGSDGFIGGSQSELHCEIERAYKNENLTVCIALLKEYVSRKYAINNIEYIT